MLSFVFGLSSIATKAWGQKGVIKIATQSPLSGEQAALGEHVKLGAQLA
ncbi:MAG: branched-chain amino acid ABC transporter substrate-binding protein, partial [Candidatus Binatota bacterium]